MAVWAIVPPAAESRSPADDAALAAAVSAGDESALEEVYDRHGALCYAVAVKVIGDSELAEDVVQEVFLALWRGTARFDGARGRLSSWLAAITHHKAVDAVRREDAVRRRRTPIEALALWPAGGPSVEEQAEAGASREEVRAALADLPHAQREVVVLAYFGGYTQREIAELTSVPLGTVKSRTLIALRRLQRELAAEPGRRERGWAP